MLGKQLMDFCQRVPKGLGMALGVAGQPKLLHINYIMDMDAGSCALGTVLSLVEREALSTLGWWEVGIGTRLSLPFNNL